MASRSPLSSNSRETIRDVAADAQYLSSNCVVYIYYSDLRAVIEDHFSKALGSQQNNFSGDHKSKDPVIPMSQRNLPLSFWKANISNSPTSGHQPTATETQAVPSHESSSSASSSSASFFMPPTQQSTVPGHELYGPEAAYHHHHHHTSRYPPIQNDPWHYTLSAAATAANPYSSHHRTPPSTSMHDLSYSSASNRFNAQYSSLLLQPRSSRLTPVSGAFDKAGADMSWLGAARYHHEAAMNFGHHHGMEAAGYSASAYGAAMSAAISEPNPVFDLYSKISPNFIERSSDPSWMHSLRSHHHHHLNPVLESDRIEEVDAAKLLQLYEEEDYLAVFFHTRSCDNCKDILEELEKIDDEANDYGFKFVTNSERAAAKKFSITTFPTLVVFRHKEPLIYEGDLMNEDLVLEWLTSIGSQDLPDKIEEVNARTLPGVIDNQDYVAVFFYQEKCKKCDKSLLRLEEIDDDADQKGIGFVKILDPNLAFEYGLEELPALVYYRHKIPIVYDGDLEKEQDVLSWLLEFQKTAEDDDDGDDSDDDDVDDNDSGEGDKKKKMRYQIAMDSNDSEEPLFYELGSTDEEDEEVTWLEDAIEDVNREMLFRLIGTKEYLAVLFYEPDDESDEILEHLENIDDDCDDYEVQMVKISDNLIAKKYGVRDPPGLVFFRRGSPIKYPGDLFDEVEVLEWLTRPENMESRDAIERVNRRMFERLVAKNNYLAVLFYSKSDCKQCDRVLEELEKIDDEADTAGIKFVKIEDQPLAKQFGVHALPALVFFRKETNPDKPNAAPEPIIFAGDLKHGEKILEWLLSQKDPGLDKIEEVDEATLRKIMETNDHVAVYFYSHDCAECKSTLEELENIDTETDKHGILFVKISDTSVALEYGCKEFPALIYFRQGAPSVYEGDLAAEEDVLQWLVLQKTEDTIESVNRELLEHLVENSHYLVAFFYKPHCRACDIVLEELEHIDDECDIYGIHMVKIQDVPLAKRYGIRTFPALMYFRNGNPLLFDGDLRNEDAVLEWLIDDDNRELQDEIEDVNARMLQKLVDSSPLLVVYFYDDECQECPEVMAKLEEIDDELDVFGIDFVKVNDPAAFSQWEVHTVPALGFFRKKEAIFYDGDLMDSHKVLSWLTSDEIFELKDEIEEVNKKMLEKLLNENDYIAVYFYEDDCEQCETILEELERIDDDADDLEIMFVKIRDSRHAKKYGVTTIPTLVFFRKKFPSVYRGDLMKEEEVLEWLRKNRYRSPEVSIFMYTLIFVTVAFILYTVFLLCFLRPRQKKEQ